MKTKLFAFQFIPWHAKLFAEGDAEGGGAAVATPPPVAAPPETKPDPLSDSSRRSEMDAAFERSKNSEVTDAKPKPEPKTEKSEKTETPKKETGKPIPPTIPGLSLPSLQKKEAAAEVSETVPELDAIQPHPKTKDVEGFNALKKTSLELIQKERGEVKRLRETVAQVTKKHEEEKAALQKEVDELRGYRSAVDIHGDPEFQNKFAKPMDQTKAAMIDILKSIGASDEAIAADLGDWESDDVLDQVAAMVSEKSKAKGTLFASKLASYLDMKAQRNEQVQNAKKNWKELTGKKLAEQEASKVNFHSTIDQTIQGLSQLKGEDGKPQYGFLAKIQESPEMSAEERKAVQAHNAVADDANQKVRHYASLETPQERTEVAVAAYMASLYYKAYMEHAKYSAQLQKELEAIAASTGGGASSRKVGSDLASENTPSKVDVNMTPAQALEARFGKR